MLFFLRYLVSLFAAGCFVLAEQMISSGSAQIYDPELRLFSKYPISVEQITRVVMRMANAHYACWETRFAVGKAFGAWWPCNCALWVAHGGLYQFWAGPSVMSVLRCAARPALQTET